MIPISAWLSGFFSRINMLRVTSLNMDDHFKKLLDSSARAHGHMCPGQVLGVRMGILGLALLGYESPLNDRDIKKVVVVIEIDRCAADALATTTGVKLGRRSLKFKDYGLMAATFVNLPDGIAFRVAVREDCRDKAAQDYAHIPDDSQRELTAYQEMSASELFTVEAVKVDIPPEDLPGWHGQKAYCDECGTVIRHRREVKTGNRTLCPVCAGNAYFTKLRPVPDLDRLDPVRPVL
jgi:formylmethanofuran dehydrogenase subunit E